MYSARRTYHDNNNTDRQIMRSQVAKFGARSGSPQLGECRAFVGRVQLQHVLSMFLRMRNTTDRSVGR